MLNNTVALLSTTGDGQPLIFNSGSPQVCSQPYLQALAEGDITGHEVWTKNGYNGALSATEQVLWAVGGDYVFPATQQQMEVVSSSANDASGGTGARTNQTVPFTTTFNTGDIFNNGLFIVKNGANCNTKLFFE